MERNTIHKVIKDTIVSFIPGSRVLLFGSHARGDYDRHSDYDLLIITPIGLDKTEKLSCSSKINHAIVEAIHAPVDLLVYSQEEVQQKQQLPGHIIRSALKEAVVL
jgi:uncharacterized protein